MANEAFPYFTSLHVNDCYTYQDFDIPIGEGEGKPFRHLILTGKNGSGKTTILKGLEYWMTFKKHLDVTQNYNALFTIPIYKIKKPFTSRFGKNNSVQISFEANRGISAELVKGPVSNQEFIGQTTNTPLSKLLKQFLVYKKVNQAFAIIEKNGSANNGEDKFFDSIESIFRNVLDDKGLKLVFTREEYEFYLHYSDGREVTFTQLSGGFSAFMSIVLELLVCVDIIQAEQKDYSLDPPGIVLIDEPETHLHLEMQYQAMPLLTGLFPNIQFIVATHSPAVVSSIKNATVFDLTTKKVANDWVVGGSFSELMTVHFGLDNEFSNIADDIMDKAQVIIDSKNPPIEKVQTLKKLLTDNDRYLSPAFQLALESHILQLGDELQAAHD